MFGRYRTENYSATSSFSDLLLMLSAIHCSTSGDDSRKICGRLFYSIHDWKEPIPVRAVQYSAQQ